MKYLINLFPEKEKSLVDKVIYFSYNYLRYILVITQLVVIYVFIFRFTIDQQIVDSKDSLSQKQEIVSVVGPLLKEMAIIENKLNNITELIDQQTTQRDMIDYVVSIFPAPLTLNTMSITKNTISFEGLTSDVEAVKIFHRKLLRDSKFDSIQLIRLIKVDQGYRFTFELSSFKITNG